MLQPGQSNCLYHREEAQEDFMVLHGEALLLVCVLGLLFLYSLFYPRIPRHFRYQNNTAFLDFPFEYYKSS